MDKKRFEESEFPYEVLSQFGLTSEMIEDLPVRVLNDIQNGKRTPVLPVSVTDDDGSIIKSRARFSLIRKDNGTVDVLFYMQILKSSMKSKGKVFLPERALLPQSKTSKERWLLPMYRSTERPIRFSQFLFRLSDVTFRTYPKTLVLTLQSRIVCRKAK